jgi:hypothetical protein
MSRRTTSPTFSLTMPVELMLASKVGADMQMLTQAEWWRQAGKDRLAAQGIDPAGYSEHAE